MKKIEYVFRELLYQVLEKKNSSFTQRGLSKELGISISTVNYALNSLKRMNSIKVSQRSFTVIDPRKILYHWASIRDIEKDTVYSTRADLPVKEIEKSMPDNVVFGAYSAYKFRFKDVPSDYSEVYVYGDDDVRKRFPESKNQPNIFVIRKDALMKRYGKTTTLAQTFVDLWNIKAWYAKEFLKKLEARLNERLLE